MKRASPRQRPENEYALVHQGDRHRPSSPPSLAPLGERATVAPRGRFRLIPKVIVGFPAEVCESE